jgi:uncharacterized membrane protein
MRSKRRIVEQVLQYLDQAAHTISLSGVVVIVGGFLLAAGRYIAEYREPEPAQAFQHFKIGLGQALMLGLEILVVADVIETITTKPTFRSLAALAFLVAIRTVFSWTLFLEVEGRWPWQAVKGD